MSLKLYAPNLSESRDNEFPNLSVYHEADEAEEHVDQVISWRFFPRRNDQPSFMEVVQRSRLLHVHRRCRDCGRPTVQPLERNDAVLGKNRLPIPGTSTVVGFHCDYCQSEWTA
jgi:hypothetical protein